MAKIIALEFRFKSLTLTLSSHAMHLLSMLHACFRIFCLLLHFAPGGTNGVGDKVTNKQTSSSSYIIPELFQ